MTPVFAEQGRGGTDISAELVGQVTNPTPVASFQYGYLSYIKSIAPAALASSTETSERTAFLSFYSDTVTKRVINNGPMRTIDRDGTLGIYLDAAPNGDFGRPTTFQDGEQVVGAEQHHQVVLNTPYRSIYRELRPDDQLEQALHTGWHSLSVGQSWGSLRHHLLRPTE